MSPADPHPDLVTPIPVAGPAPAGQTGYTPRQRGRTGAAGTARRYSRFVGIAKLLMPGVAGGLLLILALWPYLATEWDRVRTALPRLDPKRIADLRMINPRYTGIDKEQRPFTLTAGSARQSQTAPGSSADLIALDRPAANIQTREGAWVVVRGDTGMYQSQSRLLDLDGHVTLFRDKGYEFLTHSARIDLDAGTAEGEEPIAGGGPSGEAEGQGFKILQRGEVVIFTGAAHLITNGAHGPALPTPGIPAAEAPGPDAPAAAPIPAQPDPSHHDAP